jgi:pyruvate formate lyase activating enzyme
VAGERETFRPAPPPNLDLGLVSAVQRYSTNDGPGIRSTVFLKGCPLACLWCGNPELMRPASDLLHDRERCARCGACVEMCPRGAPAFAEDGSIRVDRAVCDVCGDCVAVCPEGALERVGKWMGVDELVSELLKDRIFFETSGGGVTFSGGEPLRQSGFVARAAARLKAAEVHTALDTAGEASWNRFEEVLPWIDLVLFDLKAADSERHRRYTGCGNERILANLRLLAKHGVPVRVRLVMAPGFNDGEEEILARMEIVASLGNVVGVDVLPYHRYGEGKYPRLGLVYPLAGLTEYGKDRIAEIEALVASHGIETTVGG